MKAGPSDHDGEAATPLGGVVGMTSVWLKGYNGIHALDSVSLDTIFTWGYWKPRVVRAKGKASGEGCQTPTGD